MKLPRKRFELSLRGRVVWTGTAVVAILVLALNLFVYFSLRDQLWTNLQSVLDAREQLVIGLRDEYTSIELVSRLEEANVRAVVRVPGGDSFTASGAPDLFTLPPAISDEPFVSRTIPLPDGGLAVVMASRAGIDTTLDRLQLLAGIGSLVVVGLAYGLFGWLAGRMLRPVRDVATTAHHIAEGDLAERLVPRQDDRELHGMVTSFNRMLDALEDALGRSQDAEAASRRFLADAAHQLRTPAAGIRATVAALLRTDDPVEREPLLDNLAQESARMSRLLSSLLRVAHLDRDEPVDRGPVTLVPLLQRVVEQQHVRAPHLRLTVSPPPDGDPVTLVAQVGAIEEAVTNLVDNAIRHAETAIHLEVETADGQAVVRVRDDGDGVPATERERIFERFVSLDDAGGSGLGLSIARAIAEAHDGTLVHADGAFVLRLPTTETPAPARTSAADAAAGTAP